MYSIKILDEVNIELNKSLQFCKKLKTHFEQNEQNSDTNELIQNNTQNDIHTDQEQWKDIEVYGIKFGYQVSNYGEVRNKKDNYIMQQNPRDGYKSVCLTYYDNNIRKEKHLKVHRLVALMFIQNDNPAIKTVANHIDGDKYNNHWKNLEWVSTKENNQHAIDMGLTKITKRRVTQYDLNGNEIKVFESLDAAKKATGVDDGGIVKACKGKLKTCGGFKWKYTDENPNEQELDEEELESFVQIKDFPNYLIDRAGRVYSKPYKKFLKTVKTRDNSQELQLANNGVRKTYLLHNLMAETFLPEEEGKNEVGHINRDKSDNRLVNLKRVSHTELLTMARNHKAQLNQQNVFVLDV